MSSPSRSISGRVGGVSSSSTISTSGGRGGGSGARSLLLQSPLNHSFSLENLEDFDMERALHLHQHPHPHLCHPHQAPPTPPMSRSPMASTPISDEHRGAPLLPPPCSPVRDVNMVGRRGSVLCQGALYRPMSGRIPGAVQGPRPIRCPPAALGPKWRLFKRRTCPELLKTRSSDNLFRTKGVDGALYLPRGPGLDDRMRGVREGPGKPPPDKEEPPAKASSRTRLEETLNQPPPYQQVVIPDNGEYWDERPAGGGDPDITPTSTTGSITSTINNNNNNNINNNTNKFETDESATYYRRFFSGQEHWNFYSVDASQGPVVVSQRREGDKVRILVRLSDGLHHAYIPATGQDLKPAALVKRVKEDLSVERFSPVVSPEAPQLILEYDEHALKNQFKFGLIVQRFRQTVEEQLFANTGHSPALEQFLSLMGRRVKLKEHEGFKGGLDTQFGQTGEESLYEVFREKEVMFHVSTMLPFKEQDPQQLERKRHIGNDMVAVVFQEENTPFAPDMVASHFLHAYVVVQPIDPCTPNTRYRVSVTARSDVPFFGPTLPPSSTFAHGPLFKEFLLTKLINAEMACYKAHRFAKLEARTRSSLLTTLVDDLRNKTSEFLGQAEVQEAPKAEPPTTRFRDIVASLIGRKNQDGTSAPGGKKPPQTPNTLVTITPQSTRSKGSGESSGPRTPPSSPDTTPNTHLAHYESDDSSLNSMDIDTHPHPLNEDSDTGLESMSSAETPHKAACPLCGGQEEGSCALHADPEAVLRQVEALKQEINKLKCDKLDLLRQNVTCQRDIKKLKEKELKHASDLVSATKEIARLQGLLSDFGTGQVSAV